MRLSYSYGILQTIFENALWLTCSANSNFADKQRDGWIKIIVGDALEVFEFGEPEIFNTVEGALIGDIGH